MGRPHGKPSAVHVQLPMNNATGMLSGRVADPEATKPDDWDEDAPRQIEDEDAEKADGWLDDEPAEIDDPGACAACTGHMHAPRRFSVRLMRSRLLQRRSSQRIGTLRRMASGRRPKLPTPSARLPPAVASGSAP